MSDNPLSLGAPIGDTTHDTRGNIQRQDESQQTVADAPTVTSAPNIEPAQMTPNRSSSNAGSSSADGTLTAEDEKHTVDDKTLGLPENQIGMKRSAHSSMDHVAELGGGGVSVEGGKAKFAALERRFSNMSQNSQELQRQSTRRSSISGFTRPTKVRSTVSAISRSDPEKGRNKEEPLGVMEDFDLAGTLRTGRQKSDEAGIKHKLVGVVWEDLEVVGAGGMKINIRAFPNAIVEAVMIPTIQLLGLFGVKLFKPKPKTILYKNSGVLRPGEMCLVLGRPGSGCSTFLKSIANQRDSFLAVNGDVEYAGVGWKEMQKVYAG